MKTKKIFKAAAMAAVAIYAVVFMLFIFPGLKSPGRTDRNSKIERAVLSLWHMDLFEGGTGSREGFLARTALRFEKLNPGTYISTRSVSMAQLKENLAQGNIPDIISYAPGAADILLPYLYSFEGTLTTYENFVDSGTAEGKLFAVPWAAGGYIAAANLRLLPQTDRPPAEINYADMLTGSAQNTKKGVIHSFGYGSAEFNVPLLAMLAANPAARLLKDSAETGETRSQADAYHRFLAGNSVFLLGTQRDAVRLMQRENSADFGLQALGGFTDLVCYISITSQRHAKQATAFIEYLLSPEIQRSLSSINMLSTVTDGLYSEGVFREMEQLLPFNAVLGALTQQQTLLSYRESAHKALSGDGESLKFIGQLLAN